MVIEMLDAGFEIATLQNDLRLFLLGMNQQLSSVQRHPRAARETGEAT